MKKYRKLEPWEIPFDGDIITILEPVYTMKDNTFRRVKRCCRVSGFKNACLTALLTDCKGKTRFIGLTTHNGIVAAYRKV